MSDFESFLSFANLGSLILLIIGIALIVLNIYFNSKVKRVESWPTAVATIQSAEVTADSHNDFHVHATYTYTVGGVNYTSSGTSVWGMQKFSNPAHIKGIVKGAQVNVYYNPTEPAESYIFSGETRYSGWILGIIAILIAAGLFVHYNTDLFSTKPVASSKLFGGDKVWV